MKKTHLLMIDPQWDFCHPTGRLSVAGADKDMERLAAFINANGNKLEDIHCTLDSHQTIHVAHPIFWKNSRGTHPDPFTLITADDVRKGVWMTTAVAWQAKGLHYVEQLEKNGRYQLCIWPPHCIIGSRGAALMPEINEALERWETTHFAKVDFVPKGSNYFTEHYSAVKADVPDNSDNSTKLNTDLIDILAQADEILITGEALSHCVANTVTDIADNFGADNVQKFVLLSDTTSPVPVGPGPQMAADFLKAMTKRGMKVTTTKDWS